MVWQVAGGAGRRFGASGQVDEFHELFRRVNPVDRSLVRLGDAEGEHELATGEEEGVFRLHGDEVPGLEEPRVSDPDVFLRGTTRVGPVVAVSDDDPVWWIEPVSGAEEGGKEPFRLLGTIVGPLANGEVVFHLLEPFTGSDDDPTYHRHELPDDGLQAGDLAVAVTGVLRVVATVTVAVGDGIAHGAPFCFRR